LASGELPTSSSCVSCGESTTGVAFVQADCERAFVQKGSWTINPLALLFGWLVIRREGEARVLGRDKSYRLPIRLCERCHRLRGTKLRAAVVQEPLYRRLLEKFPHARLSLLRK
jgi:hypothetical protein